MCCHQSRSWWTVFALRSVELTASIFVFSRPEVGVCQPSVPWLEILLLKSLLWDIAMWSVTVTFEAYPPLPHEHRCQFPLLRKYLHRLYILSSVVWICVILASLLSGCLSAEHHPPVSFFIIMFGLIELICLILGVQYIILHRHAGETHVNAVQSADETTVGDQELTIITEMIDMKTVVVPNCDTVPFNCTICFTDVDPARSKRFIARIAECSHLFHRRCLRRWLDSQCGQSRSCPNCRATVSCIYVSRNTFAPGTVQNAATDKHTTQLLGESTPCQTDVI